MPRKEPTVLYQIRIPESLGQRIEAQAERLGLNRNDVARIRLAEGVTAAENDASLFTDSDN